MTTSFFTMLACLALASLPVQAAPADGQHDFDWEAGTWSTQVRLRAPLDAKAAWKQFNGTSVIKPLMGGRANLVELDVRGSAGRIAGVSLRLYQPATGKWTLNFANLSNGTPTDPMTGAFEQGKGTFYGKERVNGRSVAVRFLIVPVDQDQWRFEQAYSSDGGKTWIDNWIAIDRRSALPARDGQHDFDDSFGAWQVHIARLERPLTGSNSWVEYTGTHTIAPIWNGRGSVGTLDASGPAGRIEAMSPRLYNPATRQWSVRYASGRDGELGAAHVGQFANGRGVFLAEDRLGDQAILVRNTYWAENANLHHFEAAYSADGGQTWETNWKMRETRITPPHIARAVADSARPQADRALDAGRKPADVLAFAGIAPGDTVIDLMPGGGYFTRLLGNAVGSAGRVLALQPAEMDKAAPEGMVKLKALAAAPHSNVTVSLQPVNALAAPEPADMVWTSLNYHDLHVPFMGVSDVARVNRALFAMLKPGGVLMVTDHVAAAGTGFAQSDALHRIDPHTVRAELLAAGFEFAAESDVLRNPEDSHTVPAFDAAMRGKTDRFVYKFRKPLLEQGTR